MNEDMREQMPIRVAVIEQDGSVAYKELENRQASEEKAEQPGVLLFPFHKTNVHSSSWKVSEHATLMERRLGLPKA